MDLVGFAWIGGWCFGLFGDTLKRVFQRHAGWKPALPVSRSRRDGARRSGLDEGDDDDVEDDGDTEVEVFDALYFRLLTTGGVPSVCPTGSST